MHYNEYIMQPCFGWDPLRCRPGAYGRFFAYPLPKALTRSSQAAQKLPLLTQTSRAMTWDSFSMLCKQYRQETLAPLKECHREGLGILLCAGDCGVTH